MRLSIQRECRMLKMGIKIDIDVNVRGGRRGGTSDGYEKRKRKQLWCGGVDRSKVGNRCDATGVCEWWRCCDMSCFGECLRKRLLRVHKASQSMSANHRKLGRAAANSPTHHSPPVHPISMNSSILSFSSFSYLFQPILCFPLHLSRLGTHHVHHACSTILKHAPGDRSRPFNPYSTTALHLCKFQTLMPRGLGVNKLDRKAKALHTVYTYIHYRDHLHTVERSMHAVVHSSQLRLRCVQRAAAPAAPLLWHRGCPAR